MNPSVENQPYVPEIPQPQLQETFSWAGLVSTIVIFVLILCVVLWLIQRVSRKGMPSVQRAWLRVLDRQSLSPQHTLYLVEVAGKVQIWGATEQQIQQIAVIEDAEQVAAIREELMNQKEAPVDKVMSWLMPRRSGQKKTFSGWTMSLSEKISGLRRKGKREKKGDFSAELEKLLRDDDRF